MAVPDHIFEESAKLTYDGGYWTAEYQGKPFDIYPGAQVLAWDDRIEDWANAVVHAFERNTVLVMWEDGFRFLFTAKRAAIKPKSIPQAQPEPQALPEINDIASQAFGEGYQAAISDMIMAMAVRVGRLEKEVFK